MRRAAGYVLAVLVLPAVVSPARSRACSFIGPVPHTVDATLVGVDQTPPNLPQPTVAQISRHDGTGCMSGDSCGDFTSANITNLATDDMTAPDRIGYRFGVVAGWLPAGLTLPTGVVDWAFPDASLWITWSGISDDFDFTLQLVAVDAAGNESAPQTVRIHGDSGGCSIGHRDAIGDATPAIAMFALVAAARRRRA